MNNKISNGSCGMNKSIAPQNIVCNFRIRLFIIKSLAVYNRRAGHRHNDSLEWPIDLAACAFSAPRVQQFAHHRNWPTIKCRQKSPAPKSRTRAFFKINQHRPPHFGFPVSRAAHDALDEREQRI